MKDRFDAPKPGTLCVDDDEDFRDAKLPELFLRTDAASRREAAARMNALEAQVCDLHSELELIERALRHSEAEATGYGEARLAIRSALAGLELGVLDSVDRARTAFNCPGRPNRTTR